MDLAWILAQAPDPIGGGTGWVGAGLLGAVLSWLLFVHLPSKDKQAKEMTDSKDKQLKEQLDAAAAEREKDRVSRHSMANVFQTSLSAAWKEFREESDRREANANNRSDRLEDLLRTILASRGVSDPAHADANREQLAMLKNEIRKMQGANP